MYSSLDLYMSLLPLDPSWIVVSSELRRINVCARGAAAGVAFALVALVAGAHVKNARDDEELARERGVG